ncbi:MAG: hypothetical protein M3Y87_36295, partial [Myxococcota bacterium]|nr:hypothetical protein [Myxococcota bacterium]
MRRRASFASVLGLALVACGPTAVQSTGTTPQISTAGGARRVISLTDLEEVRDVAAGSNSIFVATDDGVLVYPAESESASATARRIGRAEGLPSTDVSAIAIEPDGAALAAT